MNSSGYGREVLQIVFDLGEAHQETLRVYLDSNPSQLAVEFCKKHDLRDDAVPVVEEVVWRNLQQLFNEQPSLQQSQQEMSKSNIFDRLHGDAQIKAKRRQKQFINNILQESRQQTQQPPLSHNPWEDLYKKGVLHKEQRERIQDTRKIEQSSQEQLFSFTPFISERSQQLARKLHVPTQDHLMSMGKEMSQRKEQLRGSRLNVESQECSFRPQINEISERIFQEKTRNNPQQRDIHERLYQEGLLSQQKKKESAQHQTSSMTIRSRSPGEIPFLDRMQISILERQKRLEQTRHTEDVSIDSTTRQQLFKPQIGRPPMAERNNKNLPIGDYLYEMRKVKEDHHTSLMEMDRQERDNNRAKSSDKSNVIYENKKKRQLEEIFYYLDSDGDGLISAHSIDISGIPSDMLQILAPLLCEMEQIGANLNLEQFIEAASRLLSSITVVDRDRVLNGLKPKKVIDSDKCTFQPQLNKNSLKMVNTRPMSGHVKNNKEDIKKQQEQNEMAECTFKPRLYQPMKLYDFMINQ